MAQEQPGKVEARTSIIGMRRTERVVPQIPRSFKCCDGQSVVSCGFVQLRAGVADRHERQAAVTMHAACEHLTLTEQCTRLLVASHRRKHCGQVEDHPLVRARLLTQLIACQIPRCSGSLQRLIKPLRRVELVRSLLQSVNAQAYDRPNAAPEEGQRGHSSRREPAYSACDHVGNTRTCAGHSYTALQAGRSRLRGLRPA
mmetsp:Transcript_24993/g.81358  ORF Transcript_24993/g.81358 Transcript_24993/m.81358 type:complete len:200 (+) Transcript_24993:426-1025(+)